MREDRGAIVLVLGILSIVFCQVLGPIAWIMGSNDLSMMAAGRMDPSGKGLTQAGMICGIIGTILLVLSLITMVVMFFVIGVAASRSA